MASCIAGAILSGFHALCEIFQWTFFGDQFSRKTWRADGVVNAIYFGNIALMLGTISAISLYQNWQEKKWIWVFFAVNGATFGIIGSVLSLSRGGWLAGLILTSLFFFILLIKGKVKLLFLFSLLLVSALFASYFFSHEGMLKKRFQNTYENISQFDPKNSETSIGYRLRMWLQAIENIKESPFFGSGPDSFAFINPDPDPSLSIESEYYHAHNDYLNTLSNTGITGFIPLVFLYSMPLLYFTRKLFFSTSHQWPLSGACIVVLYACFSLTDVMFYRSVGTIYFLLLIPLFMILCDHNKSNDPNGMRST
ncbi:O-Antigen Polymerase family [gamma proteobacterium HTCC5015]|nr:O-Antigen Polymerase family [gamma proteobacterium HTCC5015]